MDLVYQLSIGAAGSILGAVILWVFREWTVLPIIMQLSASRILRHGVLRGYRAQKYAENDMIKDFAGSKELKVFEIRGYSVSHADRPLNFILKDGMKNIKILFSDPGDMEGDNAEIKERAKELDELEAGVLRTDIYSSVKRIIAAMQKNERVLCRLHKETASHRFFICDDCVYYSPYLPSKLGSESPIIKARRSSPLYEGMARYFDNVWEKSRDAKTLNYRQ